MPEASTNPSPENIGRRIRLKRTRAGLTQQGLADVAFVSRSLIQQVERGRKPATPSLVAAVASALNLDPAELYGQPYRRQTVRDDAVHAAIAEIRRVLACVDISPELEMPPRSLDRLEAELSTVRALQFASRHTKIGARLPALLEELTYHAYDNDAPRAWRLLFRSHEAAADLCRKLGYYDLASNCLERARESALRSQDPHLPLLVTLRRSLLLTAVAQWRPALSLLARAIRSVDTSREDGDEIIGTAYLRSAIVAARSGDEAVAWDAYGHAVEIRERAGISRGDWHGITTNFTRENVTIHSAAVAVELGDFDEAIRRDVRLNKQWRKAPPELPPERRAHHEIDMSRALASVGAYDKALRRLVRADKAAPQMTRYHPMARETTIRLLDHYRTLPEPLRVLQDRMALG